jgi:AcrR family transcriptional regulator
VSPAGRRPGGADTRAEILAAARAEFGERGYTAATVRQVARRAHVDPALVYHYFADKAGLFVACLNLPADPREVQIEARGGELDGARIAERFLAQWEEGPTEPGKSFVTLVQAVSSAPEVARAVHEFLTERVWARVRTGDGEAVARATSLVSSQLLGVAWARYVIRMEPLASASRSEVAAWIGPTIEAYITGRLGSPADDPPGAGRDNLPPHEVQNRRVARHGAQGEQGHDQRADVVVEVKEARPVEAGPYDEQAGQDRPGSDRPAPQPDGIYGDADHQHGEREPEHCVDHQSGRAVRDGPGDAAHRAAEVAGWACARMLGGDRHVQVHVHADP